MILLFIFSESKELSCWQRKAVQCTRTDFKLEILVVYLVESVVLVQGLCFCLEV